MGSDGSQDQKIAHQRSRYWPRILARVVCWPPVPSLVVPLGTHWMKRMLFEYNNCTTSEEIFNINSDHLLTLLGTNWAHVLWHLGPSIIIETQSFALLPDSLPKRTQRKLSIIGANDHNFKLSSSLVRHSLPIILYFTNSLCHWPLTFKSWAFPTPPGAYQRAYERGYFTLLSN